MKEIQLHRIDLNLLVVFEALMTEGSVVGAAATLGKTPSAISHALARLREQVGDPLMVKVGGRLQPSPFALTLIDDVRPILRSIKRVLAVPEPFDPATSERVFRVACPISGTLLSRVLREVRHSAPGVKLEWLPARREVYDAVSEGLIDLAHLAGETRLPDGLAEVDVPPLTFFSFVRKEHPARLEWGAEAWSRHGHVQVAISNGIRSPVDTAMTPESPDRTVVALISEFSNLGALVADSDLIATTSPMVIAWDMATYGVCPMPPVVAVPPFRTRFFWSSRLAADPASRWLREIVLRAYAQTHADAEALVARAMAEGRYDDRRAVPDTP